MGKVSDKLTSILAKPRSLKETDDEYLILKYGVERLMVDICKTLVVLIATIFLGIWVEFIVFFCAYCLLRTFGGGIHLNNDYLCATVGTVIYIGSIYLAQIITIPLYAILIIYGVLFILYFLYAPAGTKYQPIGASQKKRLKTISLLLLILYLILAITSGKGIISNLLVIASIIQCLNILPITYFILKEGRASDYEKN